MALQYLGLRNLGLRKTSLIDFPGKLAAVVFTHGCPLRCPFCHNPELVQGPLPESFLPAAEVLAFLRKRAKLLGGVVVSGGEPLLHAELPQLITEIGAMGLNVKVDTSGALPQPLAAILRLQAVTYVAMDIKTAPGRYTEIGVEWAPVAESMELLRASGKAYEFRTTCAPGLVEQADLEAIEALIKPGERWTRNAFRPGSCLDPAWNTLPATPTTLLA